MEPGTAIYLAAQVHDAAAPSAERVIANLKGYIADLEAKLLSGAAAKTEQAPRRITEETAQQYMEESLWAFIECAGNFPHVKVDDRIWPHIMVYAASSATAVGAGSAQPRAEVDERALPPLPVATARMYSQNGYRRASVSAGKGEPLFAADQMRDYARAALDQGAQAGTITLDSILNCYSPDDTISYYQDKIRALYAIKGK